MERSLKRRGRQARKSLRLRARGVWRAGAGWGGGQRGAGEISVLMATRFLTNQTDLGAVNDSSHTG